jgi:hypothetical protein
MKDIRCEDRTECNSVFHRKSFIAACCEIEEAHVELTGRTEHKLGAAIFNSAQEE